MYSFLGYCLPIPSEYTIHFARSDYDALCTRILSTFRHENEVSSKKVFKNVRAARPIVYTVTDGTSSSGVNHSFLLHNLFHQSSPGAPLGGAGVKTRLGVGAVGAPPPNIADNISPNGLPICARGRGIAKYSSAISPRF